MSRPSPDLSIQAQYILNEVEKLHQTCESLMDACRKATVNDGGPEAWLLTRSAAVFESCFDQLKIGALSLVRATDKFSLGDDGEFKERAV